MHMPNCPRHCRWMWMLAALTTLSLSSCAGLRQVVIPGSDGQGSAAEGSMRHQQQHGEWRYYHEDGSIKAEGPWRNDLRHGQWRYYHPEAGLAAQGNYRQGLRQGWWQHYHPGDAAEPVLASEGLMLDEHQHGLWLYRHRSGEIAGVGAFDQGTRFLSWQRFDAQGSPSSAVVLDGGEVVTPPPDASTEGWLLENEQRLLASDGQGLILRQDDAGIWLQHIRDPATVSVAQFSADDQLLSWWQLADGKLQHHQASQVSDLDAVSLQELRERGQALVKKLRQADTSPEVATDMAPLVVWPELDEEIIASPAPMVGLGGLSLLEEQRLHLAAQVYAGDSTFGYGGQGKYSRSSPGPRAESKNTGEHLVGTTLPQQRFILSDGGVLDLGRRNGLQLVVILRGFAGNICPYCGGQSKALLQQQATIAEHGAELTFIYPGPNTSLGEFLRAVRSLEDRPLPPFTVALDMDLALVKSLAIGAELALPTTLIIDAEGIIRYAYVGRDLMDRPTVPSILQALEGLAQDQ